MNNKHPLGKTILWLKVANTLHRQNDQRETPKATTRLYGRTYLCSDEVDGLFVSMLTSLLQELPLCAPASLAYIQWDLGRRSEWKLGLFQPCRRVRKKVSDLVSGRRPHVQCSKEIVRRDDLVQVVVLGSLSMAPSFACWSTSAAAVLGLGNFSMIFMVWYEPGGRKHFNWKDWEDPQMHLPKNHSSHIPFLNCKKWVTLGVFMQPFSCLQKGLQMIHGGWCRAPNTASRGIRAIGCLADVKGKVLLDHSGPSTSLWESPLSQHKARHERREISTTIA